MNRYFFYPIILLLFVSLSHPALAKVHSGDVSPAHTFKDMDTVLSSYLSIKEPDFRWQQKGENTEAVHFNDKKYSVTTHIGELVSLRWHQGEQDKVDKPIWQHRVTIYTPEIKTTNTALLYIDGAIINHSEDNKQGTAHNPFNFAKIAASTQSVVIHLKDVPNQFLRFSSGEPLKEDNLVAYTWARFLANPAENAYWPLQLPMVRAYASKIR